MLIAAGAVFYEAVLPRKFFLGALSAYILLITLPTLPLGIPVYGPERLVFYFDSLEEKCGIDVGRRYEDGNVHSLPQDYADMLGWETIANLTNQAYRQIPETETGIINCENYGQAGAVRNTDYPSH